MNREITELFASAQAGNEVDLKPLVAYCNSFDRVVVWGGSFLGAAVGKTFQDLGARLDGYWDLRADELKRVNDVDVSQPFTGDVPPNRTLVIVCVTNNVILTPMVALAQSKGYEVIAGPLMYMTACCGYTKATGASVGHCKCTKTCNAIYCDKLASILHAPFIGAPRDAGSPLIVTNMLVIVNTRCNLSCKYCLQYLNNYPSDQRVNYPLEQVIRDADRFFAAVDSVASITVMGGETFLHPDIAPIVRHLVTKPNIGFMNVATNGTTPIAPEQLEGLRHDRVVVCFANYLEFVTEKQREIFDRNVELVKSLGIDYKISLPMPQWSICSTLYALGDPVEVLTEKKRGCVSPQGAMQLRGGKLHPCDFSNAVHSIVRDYPGDYVVTDGDTPIPELRARIRAFMEAPYYQTCDHCRGPLGFTSGAGVQGKADFVTRPTDGTALTHVPL